MPTIQVAPVSADLRTGHFEQRAPVAPSFLRRTLPYLFFVAGITFYLLALLRLCRGDSNEGILVMGAVRTLHGQLLGRDFVEIMGPGSFYWIAAFLRLFGETFFALRLCLFVTTMATVLVLYYLSRRICRTSKLLPAVLVLASYFSTFWPEMSHHVDSNCFALIAVACLALWMDRTRNWMIGVAGFLVGLTALTLQQKGVYLFFAAAVWLAAYRGGVKVRIQRQAWFCFGFALPLAATAAYFWRHGALHDLFYATVIWPRQNYGQGFNVPYAFLLDKYFTQWIVPHLRWTYLMAAIAFLPYLFIAGIPLILPCLALLSRRKALTPEIGLYWLTGVALWLSEIHRKDIAHLVMGSPLLVLLCIYYIQHERGRMRSLALSGLRFAAVGLMMASLCVALVAHPLSTRAGVAWFTTQTATLEAIEQHVPAGSDLFIYPLSPMDYFLSRTNNPTRYSSCTYNFRYGGRLVQDEIVSALEQHRTRYVLWDKTIDKKLDRALLSDGSVPRFNLGPYLQSHYGIIWSKNDAFLLERRDLQPRR